MWLVLDGLGGPARALRSLVEAGTEELALAPSSWRDEARCIGQPLELFFAMSNPTKRARRVCGRCPVQAQCLVDAIVEEPSGMRHGFRGGLSPDQRDRMAQLLGVRRYARRKEPELVSVAG